MSDPSPAPTAPSREQLVEMAVTVKALEGIVDAIDTATRGNLLPELIAMHDAGEGKTIEANALGLDGVAKITLAVPEHGTYSVDDEEAFRDYVDDIAPDEIEMVFVVAKKWKTQFLKSLALDPDGNVINPAAGSGIVPGVKYVPPAAPSKFSVTIDKHMTAEVADRVIESLGLAETVAFTKAIEGGAK